LARRDDGCHRQQLSLNYLTLIGSLDVLHRLYGTVVVPQQVIAELMDPGAPHEVKRWAQNLPEWIDVRVAVVNAPPCSTSIRASGQQSPLHSHNRTLYC
jgi:predicted nucleic acid-binding protein